MIAHKPATDRYTTIDALRGIAALSVAIYHLFIPAFAHVEGVTTTIIHTFAQYGYLGVPLFFVISGFVISSTVKRKDVNRRFLGKFALKRSIRLDPPYWLSIAIDLAFLWLTINIFHRTEKSFPDITTILAHLFYAQDLLGLESISAIYWTLCLEVQFYIFFVSLFAISNMLNERFSAKVSTYFIASILAISLGYSLLILAGTTKSPLHGLFISNWYLFMLGAFCQQARTDQPSIAYLPIFAALVSAALLYKWFNTGVIDYYAITGVIASLFVFVAQCKDKLSNWLDYKPLLFLGSISYSLYLFHAIIGERIIGFLKLIISKFQFVPYTELTAALLFFSSLGITILFSYIIFNLVEKPSMIISKKIKPSQPTGIADDLQKKAPLTSLASL